MAEPTDGQLVERVRAGDLAAFEAIVERHRAAMVAVAAAQLHSPDDAEDVAQEAFVRAYFRLHQLRDGEALAPWLRRVTDRLALMRLRRRREEPLDPEQVAQMRRTPTADMQGAFDDLLAALPRAHRQTIALTCLAGYTAAEAAALLGVSEGTIKSRLSRARSKLKEGFAMAGDGSGSGGAQSEFTRKTMERLMREARELLAEGDVDAAARRADEALGIQIKEFFESGDDPNYQFNLEAARIKALPYKEQRITEAEANAAQYGYRLEELDWEVADVDMMSGTLGKPTGCGADVWGVPHSRMKLKLMDARDIGNRLHCSPQTLSSWVDKGCPILRCWPFARFDGITDWPKESVQDTDRSIRVIFRGIEGGELTAEQAEAVITNLGWGNWG